MPTSHASRPRRVLALLVSILPLAAAHAAHSAPPPGDWPMYGRDYAGTRYSPLTEINARNVARLADAWSVDVARGAEVGRRGPRGNPQATPIVIDGVMYLPVDGDAVLALEADTGRVIWRSELPAPLTTTARGVAYWPGAESGAVPRAGSGDGPAEGPRDGTSAASLPARILLTAGPTLVALDAGTGRPVTGFGRNGIVQIAVPWNGVPLVFENIAILGATTGEAQLGEPGDTRAFDVRTGKPLWDFHTVPLPGEPGHETWLDHGWRSRSGVNVWAWSMTLDEPRGVLYMPVSGPAANYWGGDRPGDDLFGNSIVAVDAKTGRYLWHFQTVHHDLWDSDQPSPPVLVDIERNGHRVPALASIGKTGWMFILDRTTGKPVFGVEERPVPRGDVPGEWYSPTQPFPVKPGPLARVSFDKTRDMVRAEDTSAQHVAACEALWEKSGGFYNAGPFTPFSFRAPNDPVRSTIQLPGGTGGVNWGGAAADPGTGYVFVNAHDTSLVGWIEQKRPGENYGRGTQGATTPYDRASVNGAGPYASFSAPLKDEAGKTLAVLPCYRPPWSRLVAVDANTGEIAWQSTLGITEALPEGRRRTGGSGSAGPSATGGGLVFVGATNDQRFRAFDSHSGKELWAAKLDAQVNADPMTYRGKNGKQYVAVVAGDKLEAFALP